MPIEASTANIKVDVLNYGMVGGGPGAFIGDVHRKAIAMDGKAVLVAGAFSSTLERTKETGLALGLNEDRLYANYKEMAQKEATRDDGIDFVSIVTPNFMHYDSAKTFLEKGISVVCEKPLTFTVEQAEDLKRIAVEKGCLFGVTYAYTGHVMVREAREIFASGQIGEVLTIAAEYPQDWLIDEIENENQKQAAWRTDPNRAGKANCVGDIGSHIENMVSFITGLKIAKLIANMDIVGSGRTLDNNAQVIVKYDNGASGQYWCSQVAIGNDNGLRVRVFGTKGSLDFAQEASNYLKVTFKGEPTQIYSRGSSYISEKAGSASRLPGGHPEGLHEAFANIYSDFIDALTSKKAGETVDEGQAGYPTIDMAIEGVKFINKCVESMDKGSVWVDID